MTIRLMNRPDVETFAVSDEEILALNGDDEVTARSDRNILDGGNGADDLTATARAEHLRIRRSTPGREWSAGISEARRQVVAISFESSRAFRAALATHPDLIEDRWDRHADHIGLLVDDHLIATFRMVHPYGNRLPLTDHFPDLPVSELDRQMGRLVSSRSKWTRGSRLFFYRYCAEHYFATSGRIYVAATDRGVFSLRRYEALGFVDTGRCYFDSRYAGPLRVLVKWPVAVSLMPPAGSLSA